MQSVFVPWCLALVSPQNDFVDRPTLAALFEEAVMTHLLAAGLLLFACFAYSRTRNPGWWFPAVLAVAWTWHSGLLETFWMGFGPRWLLTYGMVAAFAVALVTGVAVVMMAVRLPERSSPQTARFALTTLIACATVALDSTWLALAISPL